MSAVLRHQALQLDFGVAGGAVSFGHNGMTWQLGHRQPADTLPNAADTNVAGLAGPGHRLLLLFSVGVLVVGGGGGGGGCGDVCRCRCPCRCPYPCFCSRSQSARELQQKLTNTVIIKHCRWPWLLGTRCTLGTGTWPAPPV